MRQPLAVLSLRRNSARLVRPSRHNTKPLHEHKHARTLTHTARSKWAPNLTCCLCTCTTRCSTACYGEWAAEMLHAAWLGKVGVSARWLRPWAVVPSPPVLAAHLRAAAIMRGLAVDHVSTLEPAYHGG